MEVLATYPDFIFYKAPDYRLKYKNSQVFSFSDHLGIQEDEVLNLIKTYGGELDFLKSFMSMPKLINMKTNEIILSNVQEAKTSEAAMIGLLDQKGLLKNEGLLIHGCSAIHMFGMKFPINVYFLDREMRVLSAFEDVPVETFTPQVRDAYYALETKVHPHNIKVGDKLQLLTYSFS